MTVGRTTSAGLWRFSKEYLHAGSLVAKDAGGRFSHPAHYLFGHSIELALKAFLVARGVPYSELRKFSAYGHDLQKLLQEARRRRLGNECKLSKAQIQSILLLNQQYSSKQLEYIVTGYFSVPSAISLLLTTTSLVTSLERYCINATYPGTRP